MDLRIFIDSKRLDVMPEERQTIPHEHQS